MQLSFIQIAAGEIMLISVTFRYCFAIGTMHYRTIFISTDATQTAAQCGTMIPTDVTYFKVAYLINDRGKMAEIQDTRKLRDLVITYCLLRYIPRWKKIPFFAYLHI